MSYQVPQAILSLKQGVGRLIRDEQDRGVVVLMDPRVKTKTYGPIIYKKFATDENLSGSARGARIFAGYPSQ